MPLLHAVPSWWGAVRDAGGLLWDQRCVYFPTIPLQTLFHPSEKRGWEWSLFPLPLTCPASCVGFTGVIFDLLSCCPRSSLPSCFLAVVAGLFLP